MIEKHHRNHLRTRKSDVFNRLSKYQEDDIKKASNEVFYEIQKQFPNLIFNNFKTLGIKTGLNARFATDYINRGLVSLNQPKRKLEDLKAFDSADGIKPDGGVICVQSKKDNFNHIIYSGEVKHQGEYIGYTPISDADCKKNKTKSKYLSTPREERPPQALGNAIERFAKNANAIKTLTSFYEYNPYLLFCEGFDFHLKKDHKYFKNLKYANNFRKDSSILMRLQAGNDWLPLNKIYVNKIKYGHISIYPATIYARLKKWNIEEMKVIMLNVIKKSLEHLQKIGEI